MWFCVKGFQKKVMFDTWKNKNAAQWFSQTIERDSRTKHIYRYTSQWCLWQAGINCVFVKLFLNLHNRIRRIAYGGRIVIGSQSICWPWITVSTQSVPPHSGLSEKNGFPKYIRAILDWKTTESRSFRGKMETTVFSAVMQHCQLHSSIQCQ